MQIRTFSVGPFAENTYLLTQNNEALIVDPGFSTDEEFEPLEKIISDESLELIAVVLTHAHVDHILGLNRVLDLFDLPVYLSDKDRYLWKNFNSQALMFGLSVNPLTIVPETFPIGRHLKLGSFVLDVRYTPGHAPDHVVLYSEENKLLIAGDTLFREGIGRTDLYKGDFMTLEKSIREQLYTLPDEIIIYPGHGPQTSIGHERKNNPFVKNP